MLKDRKDKKRQKKETYAKPRKTVILLLSSIITILSSIMLMDFLVDDPEKYRNIQGIMYIISLFIIFYLLYFHLGF